MPNQSRRSFIKNGLIGAGSAVLAGSLKHANAMAGGQDDRSMAIQIKAVSSNFEREPLVRPFGFKGGYMSEIWQTASYLQSEAGRHAIGLCTQNVLWSDARVFAGHSESGGNALMYAVSERALQMVNGQRFSSPVALLDDILPEVYDYGRRITKNPDLRETFALNALVGLDNAMWLLFREANGFRTFDEMIPARFRPALSNKHENVAAVPLMAYDIPLDEIATAVQAGYFFMKIKIGQPGTQEEMLEKDKARLSAIHAAIGHIQTPHSNDGKLPYYFDANGRYEKKETLRRLLDHADKIGALGQIALIEEPFPEELDIDVSDIPIRLAADESAHTDKDAIVRIQMGYKAIALKAIAKTLSMTMKIAQEAHTRGVPCFCADLTVNPILVDWNKNVAARLASFPGLGSFGLLESNGHQNYRHWDRMSGFHPKRGAAWIPAKKGLYNLDEEFYRTGGGIFDPIPHYEQMFERVH